jgi:hypothetical protein
MDSNATAVSGFAQKHVKGEMFPEDFMSQLTAEEKAEVVAICDHLTKL